jgi:hypothetical protein
MPFNHGQSNQLDGLIAPSQSEASLVTVSTLTFDTILKCCLYLADQPLQYSLLHAARSLHGPRHEVYSLVVVVVVVVVIVVVMTTR